MKHTAKRGLHNNQVYKNEDFKQITEDPSTQVALTLEEIQALRDVELTGIQDEIRDMFVFNCSNGLRISEMESFNDTAKINEELGIATLVAKKTDEEIVEDLKEDYFRLKVKYGGEKLPGLYHRNVINREIKDIPKKANINSLVKVISVKCGQTVVENKEKWELIKNHTARRTFITHELKYNDALTVSALVGITPQTMKESYDVRTKLDITLASKERRLKREAVA
jgi:integrase